MLVVELPVALAVCTHAHDDTAISHEALCPGAVIEARAAASRCRQALPAAEARMAGANTLKDHDQGFWEEQINKLECIVEDTKVYCGEGGP